jgi:acyl-CoA thioesterase I
VTRAVALCTVAVASVAAACAWRAGTAAPYLPADHARPVTYVALGDSTVEGVGASSRETTYVSRLYGELRAVYPLAQLQNLGVAGATSADVLADQLPRALALAPDLVTVSIGPNDITAHVGVDPYERNLARIFTRLRRETRAVIVVSLIPDLAVTPRFRASEDREAVARQSVLFNDALRRQARGAGAELVDLYTVSQREVPAHPELVGADGYHPSDLGYARWAQLMWQAVRARMDGARRESGIPWVM